MKGFFTKKELGQTESDCRKCKLYKGCKSPRMKVHGKGKKKILVIAEAPGKEEDEKGMQLIGKAGQLLRNELERIDIDLDRDCWKINAINCRPPKNRTPTKREINLCKPRVESVIEEMNPHIVLLLGNIALESYLSNRYGKSIGGITKWRGFVIPDERWVIPMFHSSYVLRSEGFPGVKKIFRQDLKNIDGYLDRPLPEKHELKIRIVNEEEISVALNTILNRPPTLLAFDYETNSIKCHGENKKIICVSLCCIKNIAYVFELKDKKVIKLWKQVLRSKEIPKSAHNIKFEHSWSKEILGATVRGWRWDTMQTAHILDNRSGITGLKFQTYIRFGVGDYSSHLDKYLRSEGGGNSFNEIDKAPQKELFEYCGKDSIYTRELALIQQKEMEEIK